MSPTTRPSEFELPGDDPNRPIYTIGTVAKMVGVPAATIRTWEERYEGIVPHRDLSGRRLYSRQQVVRLRFVKEQIDHGLQPSEAHRLLENRELRVASRDHLPSPTLDHVHLRFLGWVLDHQAEVRAVLSDVRLATRGTVASLEVNFPHPELGLTFGEIVSDAGSARQEPTRPARFVQLAWSEVPELAEPLSRGETPQLSWDQLGDAAKGVYGGKVRSLLEAPLHHQGEWLGTVVVTDEGDRGWTTEDQGMVERARDLLVADFAASEARARFGRMLPSEADKPPLANGASH